jgi:hypothetical protein
LKLEVMFRLYIRTKQSQTHNFEYSQVFHFQFNEWIWPDVVLATVVAFPEDFFCARYFRTTS